MYSITSVTVWAFFNLFLMRGQLWRLRQFPAAVLVVCAAVCFNPCGNAQTAASSCSATTCCTSFWQYLVFEGSNSHIYSVGIVAVLFVVVVFNTDIFCVSLQELPVTQTIKGVYANENSKLATYQRHRVCPLHALHHLCSFFLIFCDLCTFSSLFLRCGQLISYSSFQSPPDFINCI